MCEKSKELSDDSLSLSPLAVGVLEDLAANLPDKTYRNVLLQHYQLDFFYDPSSSLATFAGIDMFKFNSE
jgi:hypothetical protein